MKCEDEYLNVKKTKFIYLIYDLFNIKLNKIKKLLFKYHLNIIYNRDWGWGIGDWGLGIGPNPQSPIPNPQSPIPNIHFLFYSI